MYTFLQMYHYLELHIHPCSCSSEVRFAVECAIPKCSI